MTQLTPTLFCVEVPREAKDFRCEIDENGIFIFYKADAFGFFPNVSHMKRVDFDFEIIGTGTADGFDFDVTTFVDRVKKVHKDGASETDYYKIYDDESLVGSLSSHYSFKSLLSSKEVYLENPLGKKPENILDFSSDQFNRWQSANSKVASKLLFIEKLTN